MSKLDRARALLGDQKLDALLVSHPASRRYLSGLPHDDHGPDESEGVLLVGPDTATLFVSRTNLPLAAATTRDDVGVEAWSHPWPAFVGARMRDANLHRVGYEERGLTVGDWGDIRSAAGGSVELVAAGDAVESLRAVKDDEELRILERALAITDQVFVAALSQVEVGMTEAALANLIADLMRDLGSDGLAFNTIVASGPHASRPHHDPTDRRLAAGEPVIVDLGAKVDGYCGDLTRTFVIGEPTEQFRTIYTIVLDAQEAALRSLRAGTSGPDGDRLARDVIEGAGYGDQFVHSLGHGLGLKVHESPSLGRTSRDTLLPGQVVTVEPGIYVDGWGGVRIEDVGVVTESGFRNLTRSPKRLADMVVPNRR